MILHEGRRAGTIGKVDSWGYGSQASCWEWPSAGIGPVVTTNTTGGVHHPFKVCKDADGNISAWPLQGWSTDHHYRREDRLYFLSADGRVFIPTTSRHDIIEFTTEQEARDYLAQQH